MYIVTGGAGFIGSALVWQLNQVGITEIVIVDNLGKSEKWKNLVGLDYVEYLHRDRFIGMVRANSLPWQVSGIVHLGACSSTTETDADFLMENNVRYSIDLCRHALEHGIRFVNASSAATYGDGSLGFADDPAGLPGLRPLNMYGYSKHLVDLWLLREKLDNSVASLKFFNVYGPNEYHKGNMRSVVCKAHEWVRESGKIRLFASGSPDYPDGGQMRDFVYVKDCVKLILFLLQDPQINGIHNVGTGRARTWNDLARAVFAALKIEPNIEYIPMPENLAGKYQNFTQAEMGWLERFANAPKFRSLEDGITDYVCSYLEKDKYLANNNN